MKHWLNDSGRGKPKLWEKNLSQRHFVYHKSHIDEPENEPRSSRWQSGDQLPEPRHGVEAEFHVNFT